MALILEVEYLSGVCFAAIAPADETPDWPPQPDRVFSALVASWAARGEKKDERQALEWLERLPAPVIDAADTDHRTSASVFVPPNDPRSDKQKNARGVLPALRSRQARRFQATRPLEPRVRLLWQGDPEPAMLDALQRLARDTSYVGHSTSLTRCYFLCERDAIEPRRARAARLNVYAGRLGELQRDFAAGRRPSPGVPLATRLEPTPKRTSVFGERWITLEHIDGDMPDLRACALVAKAIRDTLLSGYQRIGLGNEIPEIVSGHVPDGSPATAPHLAIVPLPFAGFPYADGHVIGFALVPPRGSAIFDDKGFRRALTAVAPFAEAGERRVVSIRMRERTPPIAFSPTLEPFTSKRSLDPAEYQKSARTFATVTPIVLDRHLKQAGDARQKEIAGQIAAACRNIGLPEPETVIPDRHSAVEGAPSAYPSPKSPAWMRWRLPTSLASRQLTHAVVRFARPVDGPVILGAGRFVGLGLCRPIDSARP